MMSLDLHDDPMPAAGDPSDDWEWVGPDGLTDTRRTELVTAWQQGHGEKLADYEEYLVRRYLGISKELPWISPATG